MLTEKDKLRFSRQIQLPEMGEKGQARLKQARVLVIGAGGLGCAVLHYLAAAGVGTIGIVDDDLIELSNLQRQVLYAESDLGKPKALVAAERIQGFNSGIRMRAYAERFLPVNAAEIASEYEIVVDCSDNFGTRYLINDVCTLLKLPMVYGSIHRYEGQVSVFNFPPGEISAVNYRSLYPEMPEDNSVNTCEQTGVLGVLPGMIGTMQAGEVIKIITGIGMPLSGKLLLLNSLSMQTNILEIENNPDAQFSWPQSLEELKTRMYFSDCHTNSFMKEITAEELHRFLQSGKQYRFLDVRQPGEWPEADGIIDLQIPLPLLEKECDKISRDVEVVVYCKSGDRSEKAIEILSAKYQFDNLIKLKGGAEEWVNYIESIE